jgi:hypothetical protein
LSKKSGHRKRRTRRAGAKADPAALLRRTAEALNAMADSGAKVRVSHDVIIAEWKRQGGYVLIGGRKRWKAAALIYDPHAGETGDED